MPNPWLLVPLGELLTPVSRPEPVKPDETYRILGAHWYGQGLYVKETTTGAGVRAGTLYRVAAGDFVYNRLFAWKGSFAVASRDNDGCYASNEFPCFRVNGERLTAKFLWRYFSRQSAWDKALTLSTGGTPTSRNRLKEEQFLGLRIPLPPLDEQRRIVARIEALAAKIEEARQLGRQAEYATTALFLKAMRAPFERWADDTVATGAAFRVTTGGTPSRGNPAYWGGEVKWVSSGEVNFREITDTKEKITPLGVANSNAKVYPPGTILLAMIGQGKTRGQCAILRCHAATNQNVAGIHAEETANLPEYVYWWFYSRYVESRASETGTAQPALSGERVKQIPIPLAPPDEQRRIVAYLEGLQAKVDALKRLQSETAAELDALLPSILDRAFKGDL